ncbi:UDP-N-acetylmuramate--L-alanine ligase [Taibaiella soli]|uniref:Peptidoglycan synthetase n=1 Tax=Taibaiella soli TaxID=1649169 RepID=A0A2W2BG09_9BACT|nr:Mur ligase domain-containing protein [Taibaiella soli]PZF72416.1 peptidoglycan synthetase [Taibaiella soli]
MKRIHFIAIGGAVMHQLALALHNQGNIVSGSDDEINDPAKSNLAAAGILPPAFGWHPEKITKELDAIVLGMHAKADNPELLAAQSLNIPIYSFPQYVYEVSKNKKRVVVAGSHGKTTITSMIMHVLKHQGLQFDYLVGAKLAGFDQSVQLTDAPLIILEGDEYPASVIEKRPKIFFYHPHISVLSGVAWDHINVFPTYEIYRSQFEQYLKGMDAGASLYYNNEDSEVKIVVDIAGQALKAVPYNMPDFRYENGEAIINTTNGEVKVAVFGRHNLLNMQAAKGVCMELGISEVDFYNAISTFTGAAKRLEKIAEKEGLVAYRDFAHAPSKLKATLDAVREAYPDHLLVACFELHTYSSLNEQFLSEYAHSMDNADTSIVYFSRHALELKGLPPLQTEIVKNYFERNDLTVIDDKQTLQNAVQETLSKADRPVCLLLMSSGTFDGIDWNSVASHFTLSKSNI